MDSYDSSAPVFFYSSLFSAMLYSFAMSGNKFKVAHHIILDNISPEGHNTPDNTNNTTDNTNNTTDNTNDTPDNTNNTTVSQF